MTVKRSEAPITEADLKEFVKAEADFAFEMRVLKALRDLGFECEHGGTYRDPITDKIRQFDIRAHRNTGMHHLALAVECKNLRAARPLLLHTVARRDIEAYHELIVDAPTDDETAKVTRFTAYDSAYRPGDFVGKATDQVSRSKDGAFLSSDHEVFDKITQAVNSARDLISSAFTPGGRRRTHAIIPVLVLPDATLWQVEYADDGSVSDGPKPMPTATLFLKHSWTVETTRLHGYRSYSISHLEIVGVSALGARTSYWEGVRGVFDVF